MWVLTDQIHSSYPNSTPTAASLPPAAATPVDILPPDPTSAPTPSLYPALEIPPNRAPSQYPLGALLWRSTLTNLGTFSITRYQYEFFYSSILDPSLSYQDDILAYHATIETDFQTGIINGTNPRAYAASHKNNPDNLSWDEAIHGKESEYCIAAMKKYIPQLVKHKTWERVNRNDIPLGPDGKTCCVLKSTW